MVSTLFYLWVLVFFFKLLFCTLEYVRPWWVKFWKGLFFVVTDPLYNLCRGHHLRHKELYHFSWWFYALLLVLFVCLSGFFAIFCFFLLMLFSVVFNYFFYIFCCFLSFFFCIFCFYHFFFREMVFSKVIDEIALFCRSFVLSQSSAKVSAGFTNVSGQAIAAFVHCILLPVHHPNCLCLWHS